MIEQPLFCGIRKSWNNKVDAAILSLETTTFYLENFEDDDLYFVDFRDKVESIQIGLKNHSLVIGVPVYSRFTSKELNKFIYDDIYPYFEFYNKLINTIFLRVDFELEGEVKNQAVPLAALTATTYITKEFINTKFYKY